jgi:hypothetical protein
MRRATSSLIACVLALSSGRALAADDLCAPLREFAVSVKAGERRAVRFYTIWGSNFRDREQAVTGAKRCEFDGYEPARAVCVHLMKSGYIEFAGENAKQAIECFSRKNRFDIQTRVYAISVGIPVERTGGVSRIDIDLQKNEELGGMVLTITANGL